MNAERMLAHAALVNELLFHSPSQIRLVQLICLSGDVESIFILLGWKGVHRIASVTDQIVEFRTRND